ncbi:MAG: DUF933 domain-containing protein [Acidobacteriota bacterium]
MKIGILGYPKVGKTCLWNLLTVSKRVEEHKGTKEIRIGSAKIEDKRLDNLSSLYPEKNKVSFHIDYGDLTGFSFGEVKNTVYLENFREFDALIFVIRAFSSPSVPYFRQEINPQKEIYEIEEELRLVDMIAIESSTERIEKELKKVKDINRERELKILHKLKIALDEDYPLRNVTLDGEEEKIIKGFGFFSRKPIIYAINLDEKNISELYDSLKYFEKQDNAVAINFCGKIEEEIMELEEDLRLSFMEEWGLKEFTSRKIIKASLEVLHIISFFTIGKDEVRLWPLRKGMTVNKAAGVIHSDLEKGFIKAEIIPYEELLNHGSIQNAKNKGAVRLEGKDCIVKDGDVIYIRFSHS